MGNLSANCTPHQEPNSTANEPASHSQSNKDAKCAPHQEPNSTAHRTTLKKPNESSNVSALQPPNKRAHFRTVQSTLEDSQCQPNTRFNEFTYPKQFTYTQPDKCTHFIAHKSTIC